MTKLATRLVMVFALLTAGFTQAAQDNPQVVLKTEMGDILVELFPKAAPVSVDNFVKLVNDYHYDGLIFHRVISGFMIQAGGFTFDFSPRESSRGSIVNESSNGLKNKRGTLAMARMNDPDSASAQFFINHKSNGFLNPKGDNKGYAVFGAVVAGMNVVDAIAAVETQTLGYYADVPVKPIRILSARLVNPESWTPLPEPAPAPVIEKPVPIR
ncbi:peptidylprolyl isomerase [SAR92 clade bacterium H231]|jgi:cyclophilin family peptidyl-prolyl cis-trans isomerase|nr:peptidylprolyl isomerase A [Porticoccaceae bacterium]MBT7258716.1 peptidylprolyl isomerase A [Porticoccaceae bacterium]MCT2533953.1 peptidylprolyl isomerase [SAR92 clade bacterium H231]MDA8903222.1 peptidylprolyl isomerase [Porticoccaceae bacterium]MDG1199396.1 peptidylprolyl isomerase [Porticoccaceae bacterium]